MKKKSEETLGGVHGNENLEMSSDNWLVECLFEDLQAVLWL